MDTMEWVCTVAAIMATLAIIARIVLWTSRRSHRLASEGQSPTVDPTELCETAHHTEANDKAHSSVATHSEKKT